MYSIQHSVEGHVTDFLITRELLNLSLLNQSSLSDSIYREDNGLFYSASTAFLTHVNEKNKAIYFLIVTLRSYPKDLTTLFAVINMGWLEGDHRVKYETSDSFYQIHWKNVSFAQMPQIRFMCQEGRLLPR